MGKTLRENSKIGTLVGYVRFNDLDDLSSQTFTWQVKNINPAEEGKVNFKITDVVANEKEEKKHSFYGKLLTAVGDLNYEQHRLYVIEVEISDGMYAQKKEFEIKLSDSNDNAPSFLDFAQNLVVGGDKTSASGKGSTVIGTFPKKCDGSFSADDKGKDKGAATAKACALTYLTVEGNKKDVWAVKTGNTQAKGRYPQWEPLCPAKLMLLEGAVTCKHLKTEDFVNEDIVVVDQTKFCADPEYAEFQNLGKDNPDYVAVTSECQTKR